MTTTYRIETSQLRLISLERDGQWLLDHHEVEGCHRCADFVTAANRLFEDVFELDITLREEAFARGEAAVDPLEVLLLKCYLLAATAERLVTWFERKGHAVEGAETLRTWLRELETCNRPSREVSDWLETKRLAAVAEHRRGETLAGWAD